MELLTTKDLAHEMLLHPRTVKRWWKKLRVPPLVAANGAHRWTRAQANRLIKRWAAYWQKHGLSAKAAALIFSGARKQQRNQFQLELPLYAKTKTISVPSQSPTRRASGL